MEELKINKLKCLLSLLPIELLNYSLLYLKWDDFGRFDTSLNQKELRKNFLNSISSSNCIEIIDDKRYGDIFMKWIYIRNIRIENFKYGNVLINRNNNDNSSIYDNSYNCYEPQLYWLWKALMNQKNIKCFDIMNNYSLSDLNMFIIIDKIGSNLQSLSLVNCINLSTKTLIKISSTCLLLNKILIRCCNKMISYESMKLLSKSAKKLSTLVLIDCETITNKDLINFAINTTNLQTLKIPNCKLITSQSIIEFGKTCHDLVSIRLTNCKLIDDDGICSIAKGCKNLVHIGLGGCQKLTDISICALIVGCNKNIKLLDLDYCIQITSISVLNICLHCSSIQSLELKNCYKITNNDLINLCTSCPLKYINIDHCSINISTLESCRLNNPNINICGSEKQESL